MKKFFIYFSLTVLLIIGSFSMYKMATESSPTYDGSATKVYDIMRNPENYTVEKSDGVANIMVKETINRTGAINAVTAVVFDFRGYDTLGESFVLLTAISCTAVILRKGLLGRSDSHEEKH